VPSSERVFLPQVLNSRQGPSATPDTLTEPSSKDRKIELNEEELSRVSGGACVTGKHIAKASITP
jgi:bacteriocin-like protein